MEILKKYQTDEGGNFYSYTGTNYHVPDKELDKFYAKIKTIQKNGVRFNMHEKSLTGRSGFWIDLDIYQGTETQSLMAGYMTELIQIVDQTIVEIVKSDCIYPYTVFVLKKEVRKYKGQYKDSAHIRIPKFQVGSNIRKIFLSLIHAKTLNLFSNIYSGKCSDISSIVDQKVYDAYPITYGCIKEGDTDGAVHVLDSVFVASGNRDIKFIGSKIENTHRNVSLINGVYDSVLEYGEVDSVSDPNIPQTDVNKYIGDNDFMFLYNLCKSLTTNIVVKNYRKILLELSKNISDKEKYITLGNYIGVRNGIYTDYYREKMENIFDDVPYKTNDPKYLCYLSRESNPDKYYKACGSNIKSILYRHIVKDTLDDFNMDSLCKIVSPIYFPYYTTEGSSFGRSQNTWYEFVTESASRGQAHTYPTYLIGKWKRWRMIPPTLLNELLKIQEIFKKILDKIRSEYLIETDENKKKKYLIMLEKGKKSSCSLSQLFGRPFEKLLFSKLLYTDLEAIMDSDERFMGVQNGILKIECGTCEFINLSMDIFVSKCANANYTGEYDPGNPYHKRIWEIISTIFRNHPTILSFFMKLMGSSLSNDIKDIFFVLITVGNSGKSTLKRYMCRTLGNTRIGGYTCSQRTSWLEGTTDGHSTSSTSHCDKARMIFVNELGDGSINHTLIKDFWDDPASRDIYMSDKEIQVSGPIVAFRNDKFTSRTTDTGFWRRTFVAEMSNTFNDGGIKEDISVKTLMDPSNPDSQHYRDAFLAILIYYYKQYYQDYTRNKLSIRDNIPAVIKSTTHFHRISCDLVYRYYHEYIIPSTCDVRYSDLRDHFVGWCSNVYNISGAERHLGNLLKYFKNIKYDHSDRPDVIQGIELKKTK